MLVPLSLSRGKIDYYILPLYPPVSLAIGHFFAMRTWGALERSWAGQLYC
jgi:4-amino-4-deoxy-L-arabinose transferase-like glycosyltransferase